MGEYRPPFTITNRILSQIDKVLDEISAQIGEKSRHLPERVRKLLEVMEYGVSYTLN